MDEFDEQIARARLEAHRAQASDDAERARAEAEEARRRALNDDARRSLEGAWRRVNAAITVRRPEPDGLLVSRIADKQMEAAVAAKEAARRRSLFPGWKRSGLDTVEFEAIRDRNTVHAWLMSEQLALQEPGSEVGGSFSYRAVLAADGCVYCLDAYQPLRPDLVCSSHLAAFGPGDDLSAHPYVLASDVVRNYGQIKAGLASLVVKYDLKI